MFDHLQRCLTALAATARFFKRVRRATASRALNPGASPPPLNPARYDPFISAALGPNPKMERMRAASLRLGGQGLKTTHDDHLIIVGDAAGHIDPLTGEHEGVQLLIRAQGKTSTPPPCNPV